MTAGRGAGKLAATPGMTAGTGGRKGSTRSITAATSGSGEDRMVRNRLSLSSSPPCPNLLNGLKTRLGSSRLKGCASTK